MWQSGGGECQGIPGNENVLTQLNIAWAYIEIALQYQTDICYPSDITDISVVKYQTDLTNTRAISSVGQTDRF